MDTIDLLRRAARGDSQASADLYGACYADLRAQAGALMRGQRPSTLQPTVLVHEAWLKLRLPDTDWEGRRHFLRAATAAMRSILVDHARARLTQKRGGGRPEVLAHDPEARAEPTWRILALEEGLTRLEQAHPLPHQVAQLRIFAGLSHAEIAQVLDVTERTVERHWATAREHLVEAL